MEALSWPKTNTPEPNGSSANRQTERAVDRAIIAVLKISKSLSDLWRIIPFKTPLDAYSRGNNFSSNNEPDMVDRELKEKQRKKRRGLRM